MIDQHRETYKEEAYELLTELESSLLELEENPEDGELIGRVFRAMHTIKGSGAMFGFDDIAAFTHQVETVFDLVRNGKISVTKTLFNLTLAARDQIKAMLDADGGGGAVDEGRSKEIISALQRLCPGAEGGGQPTTAGKTVSSSQSAANRSVTFRIRFRPDPNIMLTGNNPISLLNELRDLGECLVVAQLGNLPELAEMNPEECHLFWDVILTTVRGENAVRDVFIFVEDDCELKIDLIDDGGCLDIETDYRKLGDILVERGDLSAEDLARVFAERKLFGETLVERGLTEPGMIESALVEQQHVRELRSERKSAETAASIRVPTDKLDSLVNLVGELVTVQARLSRTADGHGDSQLTLISEEVERLTAELRDMALSIRMLPIGTTFSKFKRLVRDLSAELGKEVEMTTDGGETELDKTVIERLNDPLIHIIRNSIDHGIESPDIRTAKGKTRFGTVHLAAVHSGDSVFITVRDDGGGLDKNAIRAKALEKGIIAATAEPTENELYALIFAPGFSTAAKVTDVSGRGVGMDVVKRAIDDLRGTIEIGSEVGVGTTISIRIPLTLAIIESLLVQIGDDCFVLPLSLVDECIELTREDVAGAHGRNLVNVRGRLVPYIPLREQFTIKGSRPAIEQIVITKVDGAQVGFVVDQVIGEHQTVIKSLGRMHKDIVGVSGATILGDGSVALILDVPRLVRQAETR